MIALPPQLCPYKQPIHAAGAMSLRRRSSRRSSPPCRAVPDSPSGASGTADSRGSVGTDSTVAASCPRFGSSPESRCMTFRRPHPSASVERGSRVLNLQPFQQVGMNLVPLSQEAQFRLGVDGLDAHHPHEPCHSLPIHPIPLGFQPRRHPSASVERGAGVLSIDQVHELQILLALFRRLVVQARPADAQ